MNIYCTYLTCYSGNKLPPFYIGSTNIFRIKCGYRGSVSSKQYKKIWLQELKDNPQLFKTKIISTHETRELATIKENKLQNQLNVVKSCMYINKSNSTITGFFGMDVSGKNNPNHGHKWSDDKKIKASISHKKINEEKPRLWISNHSIEKSKHIYVYEVNKYLSNGWEFGRKYFKTDKIAENGKINAINRNKTKVCCLLCHKEYQAHLLYKHIELHTNGILYEGINYTSYRELKEKTGYSEYKYRKYIKNK